MQTNVTTKHQIVRPLIASMMLLTSPSRAPKMEVRVCVPARRGLASLMEDWLTDLVWSSAWHASPSRSAGYLRQVRADD